MTHTFKTTVQAALAAAMLAALPMSAQADAVSTNDAKFASGTYEVAGTKGMDRRGDRRDDRQDCRGANGAVGKDKRDCKQDARQG